MPRKDIYHDSVKIALEKDGWRIIKEELQIETGGVKFFIDLEAEAVFVAEREGEQIAIEIKTFQGQSLVQNLHEAFGKYRLYLYALEKERPELHLFLAIPVETYNTFFQREFVRFVIQQDKVNLIVYNPDNQTIVQWIIH
jgi:hypothetical protein